MMDNVALEKRLTSIENQIKDMQCDVNEIKRDIGGNGKTGIADQVLLNTERINNMLEAEKSRQEYWRKISQLIIGTVVTNIGVILVTVILVVLGLR